ncbi:MAG TPA: hypothetical protein VGK90_01545 [Rhizomicrobium sp.]
MTLIGNTDRAFAAMDGLPRGTGNVLLAAMLVLAGIGAAISPFLASLLSAAAGLMTLHLVIVAATTPAQKTGRSGTTHLIEAV